jgi:hypothetical protein
MSDDLFRDAAAEESRQAGATMGSHHDQKRAPRLPFVAKACPGAVGTRVGRFWKVQGVLEAAPQARRPEGAAIDEEKEVPRWVSDGVGWRRT